MEIARNRFIVKSQDSLQEMGFVAKVIVLMNYLYKNKKGR